METVNTKLMKVCILFPEIDDYGFNPIREPYGVFSTREKALKYRDKRIKKALKEKQKDISHSRKVGEEENEYQIFELQIDVPNPNAYDNR